MWLSRLCYPLLLIVACTVAAASGKRACSPFQMRKPGLCIACPGLGLARQQQPSCYDHIEVRWVQTFRKDSSVDAVRLSAESNPILKQSIDTVRYQELTPSNVTIGHMIRFTVGFLDMKKHVDKFLIWKPKQQNGSDCAFDASQYKFYARPTVRSLDYPNRNLDALELCHQSDMDGYVILTCNYQRVRTLEMAKSDGQELTECDVPAEVEAYGTEVTPQIVFSAEVKKDY